MKQKGMMKYRLFAGLLFAAALTFIACFDPVFSAPESGGGNNGGGTPPASSGGPGNGISLDRYSLTLTIGGETATLTATVSPSSAVLWTSNNTGVATVDSSGLVTAVGPGTAVIAVTTAGGKTATCAVTVIQPAAGVSLNINDFNLGVGGTTKLIASVVPANASNQAVTWSSSNTAAATVDDSGLVTAVATGTARITVTTVDGEHTDTCTVTVGSSLVPVTGVSLSPDTRNLSLAIGSTSSANLTAIVTPANASNRAVSWSSSNPGAATVSDSGVVTAVGAGTAVITVTTVDGGKTAACTVTVTAPVTDRDLTSLVTAPAAGASPVTTAINAAQYTGTVAWRTSEGAHSGGFQLNSVYKAVVTLTAKSNYTFDGVPANAFSHTGASNVTNSANSGTVTITFPSTAGTVSIANLNTYLASLPANTAAAPYTVPLAPETVIDTEDTSPSGVWATIDSAVRNAGRYVNLDLSACSAAGNAISGSNETLPSGPNKMNIIWNNQYIKGIVLPSSLTSIGDYVFYGCIHLTTISVDASNTNYSSEDGVLFNSDVLVCYPAGKGEGADYIIPSSVTSIEGCAFAYSSLGSVTIPNSVTSIGDKAFSSCSRLTTVTIPSGVTASIFNRAFSGCSSLRTVTIIPSAGGDTSIGQEAFYNCRSLTSVSIQNGVTSIGDKAFSGCSRLTSVTIPGSVTSIGREAFSSCTVLTSVTIPSSVTRISSGTFYNCRSLISVTFTSPSSVTSIREEAFSGCSGLTTVTIPGSVTSIRYNAFYGCSSLTSITFGEGSSIIYFSDSGNGTGWAGLKTAYRAADPHSGTYTRLPGGETWTKQEP